MKRSSARARSPSNTRLLANSAGYRAFARSAAAPARAVFNDVTVAADAPWVDSGIDLETGGPLNIAATGIAGRQINVIWPRIGMRLRVLRAVHTNLGEKRPEWHPRIDDRLVEYR